jgi:hypothetical protein
MMTNHCQSEIKGLGWDEETISRCHLEAGHTGHHVARVPQFLSKCGMGKVDTFTSDEGARHHQYHNKGETAKIKCWWFGTYRGYINSAGRLCDFTMQASEEKDVRVR